MTLPRRQGKESQESALLLAQQVVALVARRAKAKAAEKRQLRHSHDRPRTQSLVGQVLEQLTHISRWRQGASGDFPAAFPIGDTDRSPPARRSWATGFPCPGTH